MLKTSSPSSVTIGSMISVRFAAFPVLAMSRDSARRGGRLYGRQQRQSARASSTMIHTAVTIAAA
jgi:hypothetical protein